MFRDERYQFSQVSSNFSRHHMTADRGTAEILGELPRLRCLQAPSERVRPPHLC